MSVSLPAAVDVFKLSKTRPDNCWKPTVWRSVGAADRWLTGMYVIKGKREGISAWTEWLWSGCGRPAVTGHIWPMAHSWTLMSGCQVSERSPVGALHCWYHFLAVYMNSCLILRGITTLLQTPSPTPPPSPLHQVTDDNTNNDWQLCTHETVFFTGNHTINVYTVYKMKSKPVTEKCCLSTWFCAPTWFMFQKEKKKKKSKHWWKIQSVCWSQTVDSVQKKI